MTSIPKPSKKKKKLIPLPKLITKADKVFSLHIRKRDAIELNGKCATCGDPGDQCGHFVKRTHKKIRWNPMNAALQCRRCNFFLDGNEAEFSRYIINKYGLDTFHWLLEQKGSYKPTRDELERIIEAYS